ncbi:MAG: thiamine phosphate synthase [Bacteroidia bacterium]
MTNLIVISSESNIENETGIINDLFHSGMRLFHIRKPAFTLEEQHTFLKGIEKQFHDKISVHQHYETVNEFGLKYCHMKESDRKKNNVSSSVVENCSENLKYSTSFHNYTDLQFESHHWDYCFFGPVFDSISKTDYKSKLKKEFHNEGDLYQRVFALGGITKENIEEAFKKEFYGAAILGSVWKDPANAVKNFKELEAKCRQNVHTY